MKRLQRGQGAECFGDPLQHALRDGDEVEQLTMPAMLAEVGVGHLQHFDIATATERRAQHGQRRVEIGERYGWGGGLQVCSMPSNGAVKKKRRTVADPPLGLLRTYSPKR